MSVLIQLQKHFKKSFQESDLILLLSFLRGSFNNCSPVHIWNFKDLVNDQLGFTQSFLLKYGLTNNIPISQFAKVSNPNPSTINIPMPEKDSMFNRTNKGHIEMHKYFQNSTLTKPAKILL